MCFRVSFATFFRTPQAAISGRSSFNIDIRLSITKRVAIITAIMIRMKLSKAFLAVHTGIS